MLSVSALQRLERDLEVTRVAGVDADRSRQHRRDAGAYFTPEPLVRFVVDNVLTAFIERRPLRWDDQHCPDILVLDPAAGDGRFLAAVVDHLAALAAERGANMARVRETIAERCVVGIERDPAFAEAARSLVGGAEIHCREALLDPPTLGNVDVVVGNPPYQRSIHLAESDPALWDALRGRYAATSHGEWDLYAVFLERALQWVRPEGEVGLVVPSRWLTASFAAPMREQFAEAAVVRAIVDFGALQLFEGATTYASLTFLTAASRACVSVARYTERGWDCGSVPTDSLSADPWRLSVGSRRTLLQRLASTGPALGDVARIAKGTGTNADRVFVIDHASVAGERATGWSSELGMEVELETALTRPCLRGRDVRGFGRVDGSVRLLVPYDMDASLLEPDVMQRCFPMAWAYLSRCRQRLEARERGRFRGDRFYCFGRPQNLAFLFDAAPKVVVPDVAKEGRAMLDDEAAMVLDSAYALRPLAEVADAPSPELLVAVLNAPIVQIWLSETGIALRGGYVRLKTAYLRSLPLPDPDSWRRISAAVIDGADADTISEHVRVGYEIDREIWNEVSR